VEAPTLCSAKFLSSKCIIKATARWLFYFCTPSQPGRELERFSRRANGRPSRMRTHFIRGGPLCGKVRREVRTPTDLSQEKTLDFFLKRLDILLRGGRIKIERDCSPEDTKMGFFRSVGKVLGGVAGAVAGGVGGFLVGGPVGAIAGGVAVPQPVGLWAAESANSSTKRSAKRRKSSVTPAGEKEPSSADWPVWPWLPSPADSVSPSERPSVAS